MDSTALKTSEGRKYMDTHRGFQVTTTPPSCVVLPDVSFCPAELYPCPMHQVSVSFTEAAWQTKCFTVVKQTVYCVKLDARVVCGGVYRWFTVLWQVKIYLVLS